MKNRIKMYGIIVIITVIVTTFTLSGCASTPNELIGKTLEQSLGKPISELKEMLGKTKFEFETLLGRKLKKDEVFNNNTEYFISDFPKKRLETFFRLKDEKVSIISIGVFPGVRGFNNLAEQTDSIFDSSILRFKGVDGSIIWLAKDVTVTLNPPKDGNTFWIMSK